MTWEDFEAFLQDRVSQIASDSYAYEAGIKDTNKDTPLVRRDFEEIAVREILSKVKELAESK